VTKQYFDTDSRLNSARVMEQRLIDILKTKTGKVADLLEVERELGRVRAQIEEMQGALKYMDAQVQFATGHDHARGEGHEYARGVLLKRARGSRSSRPTSRRRSASEERDRRREGAALVVDARSRQLRRSDARLVLLIVPEEADALIDRIKGMGRVQNYTEAN
jgi:hypothetical protein